MKPVMFRPNKNYLNKIYIQASLLGIFVVAMFAWLGNLIGSSYFGTTMGPTGLIIGLLLNILWILPSIMLINRYYHSLHYELHEDEVIMHVGVITKTVKHVPFRTVTNIKVKRGPFDRIFGLGTIDIQTAGRSGESGAEESLVGLIDVRTVYKHIAAELRRFKTDKFVPGIDEGKNHPNRKMFQKMLGELHQIRKMMENNFN